jgi:hypothetical protein
LIYLIVPLEPPIATRAAPLEEELCRPMESHHSDDETMESVYLFMQDSIEALEASRSVRFKACQ